MKGDLDQAWLDWKGWRVNYDAALLGLCGVVVAPTAMWSGDRPVKLRRPPIVLQSRASRKLVERNGAQGDGSES
jgi:hypothetical protein